MMQRLREALLRPSSAEPPDRTTRPNELRLDVVRAERLRRESRRAEPAVRQPARPLEERQERRPLEPAAAPALRSRQLSGQIASLKTRSGLRQAWLIKEILGPPPALRNPYDDRAR